MGARSGSGAGAEARRPLAVADIAAASFAGAPAAYRQRYAGADQYAAGGEKVKWVLDVDPIEG